MLSTIMARSTFGMPAAGTRSDGAASLELGPADVHIWSLHIETVPSSIDVDWSILDEGERTRAARFRSSIDRDRFVVGRSWVKQVLAGYLGVVARDVQFCPDRYGKPLLPAASGRHCSWSHSRDKWLLAVAAGGAIGLDVETFDASFDWAQTAQVAFHEQERAFVLAAETGTSRLQRFYNVWTRKEALLKGLGTGLHDDMERLTIAAPHGRLPAVLPMAEGGCWHLTSLNALADCAAALATSFMVAQIWYLEGQP